MADTPEQDRAEVYQDIKESGAAFQLSRTERGYNASAARVEEGGTATYDTYAADWQYRVRDIDGTLIRQGDIRLLVAAQGNDGAEIPMPLTTDTATYAGECLKIVSASAVRKAGVAILYDVQLRR